MEYKQALAEAKKLGAARATGEPEAAMYASIIPGTAGFREHTAPKFYEALRNAQNIHAEATRLIMDHAAAMAVALDL